MTRINDLQELVVGSNMNSGNAGGASYEWQPFTPNWGYEAEFYWPVSGLLLQRWDLFFSDSWSKVDPLKFRDVAGFRVMYESLQDSVRFGEFEDLMSVIENHHIWNIPRSFPSMTFTLRVWCENDEWMRLWVNNNYVGSAMITPDRKRGPTRRAVRFFNASLADLYIRKQNHYDRPPSVPPKSVWTSVFYDDFERADGPVGNGWTQLGTDAAIVGGTWAHTGTANNSVGLLRNVGNLNGRVRVEAVVQNVTDLMDASLIACCNAAGDQALVANFRSNRVYLSRMTSSVNGTPSFFDFQDTGVTVANGDKIALGVFNNISWFEVNGVVRLYAGNVHNVVPETNAYAGLRVRREGSNSAAFRDVRISSGVGL
ncbi:hypothetical protein AB0G00_24180 [Nocardia salmonicida]|uniref:hypothetical protein n=1 Tax=Nocardia salmonicida TaxID=53431 RepID=UPI0034111E44